MRDFWAHGMPEQTGECRTRLFPVRDFHEPGGRARSPRRAGTFRPDCFRSPRWRQWSLLVCPAFVCGLPADAHGPADVRPGCSGAFGGGDGFVEPMAGLLVFACCRFHTEDGF